VCVCCNGLQHQFCRCVTHGERHAGSACKSVIHSCQLITQLPHMLAHQACDTHTANDCTPLVQQEVVPYHGTDHAYGLAAQLPTSPSCPTACLVVALGTCKQC
jgi:hypothetical protein